MRTPVTLVTARSAAVREAAIAARIDPSIVTAVLAEGLPDGHDAFRSFADNTSIHVVRIAPGCPCCVGNITMRVTLNRLLRMRPAHLYLALATTSHLPGIQEWLSQPPYDTLLTLSEIIDADNQT